MSTVAPQRPEDDPHGPGGDPRTTAPEGRPPRSWWRRNRWALLALPFVLALTTAASSYRILTLWNPWQLTDPVAAAVGEPVRFTDEITAGVEDYPIELELSAGPARQVTSVPDPAAVDEAEADAADPADTDPADAALGNAPSSSGEPVPEMPGTVVWQIDLTVTADPDEVLRYCQLRLVDEQERETAYSTVRPGILVSGDPCVPAAAPGPEPDLGLDLEPTDAPPRPETYTVPVIFRTAEDFVPARLDVYWKPPRYAALELTTEGDR